MIYNRKKPQLHLRFFDLIYIITDAIIKFNIHYLN